MTARIIMKLRVAARYDLGDDLVLFEFRHPLRPTLPEWEPGAHVDLRLPDGKVRQYSLVSDPADLSRYSIIVRREVAGRGGSAWVHDNLFAGDEAHVSAPRNNFPLVGGASVFIGGGIGVTPMIAMARAARAAGQPFTLHYCCREATPEMTALLRAICGDAHLSLHQSTRGTRMDVAGVLGALDEGTHIYGCGPDPLLDAIRTATEDRDPDEVHFEVFAATLDENFKPEPFDIVLASSGQTLHVPAEASALDVLRAAGYEVASSCELGVCGSCKCGYSEGTVIHRDVVLPVKERQSKMMLCVSRARVSVTLDL